MTPESCTTVMIVVSIILAIFCGWVIYKLYIEGEE